MCDVGIWERGELESAWWKGDCGGICLLSSLGPAVGVTMVTTPVGLSVSVALSAITKTQTLALFGWM